MVAFRRYRFLGFLLLGLNVLMLTNVHGAKRSHKKRSGDEWDKPYCPTGRGDKKLEINIECPKKYVLADLEILAGRIMNKCNRTVYGRTPDLITAVNHCYWNQSCTIHFPRMKKMVTCGSLDKTGEPALDNDVKCNCFWEEVEFLRPIRAKCVKLKEVITICDATKLPKRQGMIKSHKEIPWNYEHQNRKCSISLDVKKKKLAISVKFAELYDEDTLTIKTLYKKDNAPSIINFGNNTNTNELIEIQPNRKKEPIAKLEFNVTDGSRGSGGFIVCYKVLKKTEKVQNVCDSLSPKRKQPKLTVTSNYDPCN